MKKLLIVLLAAFFAVSCSMQVSDKTGSLTLSGARGVVTDLAGADADVRYSLTRNGKTIPLNGQSVLEVGAFDTVTIEGLIPGDGYELAVSVGNQAGNNFDVDYYGYSATFAISEGTNSAVNVALQNAPDFTWLTSSGGNSSAAVVGSIVNVLDGDGLRTFTTVSAFPDLATSPVPTGLDVNSLSVGKSGVGSDELWLNTTTGLYQNDASTKLDTGHSGNVLFSRAVSVSDGETSGGIGVYSGGGSNIGFRFSDSYEFGTTWQTITDYPDITEYLPEITQDIIRSVAINEANKFFYVATPLGTVIGSAGSTSVSDLLAFDDDPLESTWLKIPGGESPITLVSTAGTRVFAASTTGLYSDTVNTTTAQPETGLVLVEGTAGKKFIALESFNYLTGVLSAAVTDDNSVLLINGVTLLNTLPAATGIPMNAKPVFYVDSSNFIHVILSGTNGSVDYETSIVYPAT